MLLQKAMRYYRLWIYTCNAVLLLGVVVFAVTAGEVLSDDRARFVPVPMYHPTLIYAYLALVAQGGLLQAVGCYGAMRLDEKWLNIYWMAMLVLLVGDVVVGIAWIFLFGSLTHALPAQLWARLQNDYGYEPHFTRAWNDVQKQLDCCGVYGPRDYNATRWAAAYGPNYTKWLASITTGCSLAFLYQQPSAPPPQRPDFLSEEPHAELQETVVGSSFNISSDSLILSALTFRDAPSVFLSSSTSSSTPPPPSLMSFTTPRVQSSEGSLLDRHPPGCAKLIQEWMRHCADILFVLGYCVIAFLKLCFLGILRYEIKEMIQKIKILHGEMPAFPELMALGLQSPLMQHKNQLEEMLLNSSSHHVHLNSLNHVVDPTNHHLLMNMKGNTNGNNNDLELMEMPRPNS